MFLTREDFHYSLDLIEAFESVSGIDDIKSDLAANYARNVFDDFDKMSGDDQEKVIEMILEDMSENYYNIS